MIEEVGEVVPSTGEGGTGQGVAGEGGGRGPGLGLEQQGYDKLQICSHRPTDALNTIII